MRHQDRPRYLAIPHSGAREPLYDRRKIRPRIGKKELDAVPTQRRQNDIGGSCLWPQFSSGHPGSLPSQSSFMLAALATLVQRGISAEICAWTAADELA